MQCNIVTIGLTIGLIRFFQVPLVPNLWLAPHGPFIWLQFNFIHTQCRFLAAPVTVESYECGLTGIDAGLILSTAVVLEALLGQTYSPGRKRELACQQR
jgi:hypothetical protein